LNIIRVIGRNVFIRGLRSIRCIGVEITRFKERRGEERRGGIGAEDFCVSYLMVLSSGFIGVNCRDAVWVTTNAWIHVFMMISFLSPICNLQY